MSQLFQSKSLSTQSGESVSAASLDQAKVIALYFAAEWCPDCVKFTPILKDFYEAVNKENKVLEIVFIGSDNTEEDQKKHFNGSHGNWLMLPFCEEQRQELKRKYGVCASKEVESVGVTDRKHGIPGVVVIESNGDVKELNGADLVESKGAGAVDAWL